MNIVIEDSTAAQTLLDRYCDSLRRRYPAFRLVSKTQSPLSRLIDVALRLITLGGQDRYISQYTTTLGCSIYVPENWDSMPPIERYLILRHEAVHVDQFLRYGLLGMSLRYLFWPLPFGYAWGRRQLELEGYKETLIATWQVLGPQAAKDPRLLADIVRRFTGPDYGWMWIDGKSIDKALRDMIQCLETQPPPPLNTRPEGKHL